MASTNARLAWSIFALLSLSIGGCAISASDVNPLTGRWRVTEVNSAPTLAPTTLDFRSKGTFEADAPCNHVEGYYEQQDHALVIGQEVTLVVSTFPAHDPSGCRYRSEVDAQQRHIFSEFLFGQVSVERRGEAFVLTNARGQNLRLER